MPCKRKRKKREASHETLDRFLSVLAVFCVGLFAATSMPCRAQQTMKEQVNISFFHIKPLEHQMQMDSLIMLIVFI
jgi:hypothetical protein